jgi:hypothetical protein
VHAHECVVEVWRESDRRATGRKAMSKRSPRKSSRGRAVSTFRPEPLAFEAFAIEIADSPAPAKVRAAVGRVLGSGGSCGRSGTLVETSR